MLAVMAAGAVSCIAACVDQTVLAPNESITIVHAVLDAAVSDQYVIVQRSNGAERATSDVSGAEVTIIPPSGNAWAAREELDSVRVDFSNPGRTTYRVQRVYHVPLSEIGESLRRGATYRLHITMPDGSIITGRATIPDAAAIDSTSITATTFNIVRDSLELHWQRVGGARGYAVQVHSQLSDYSTFVDTTITLTRFTESGTGDLALVPGVTNQIVVSAVDSNYFDYYRRGADPFLGVSAVSHLTGAVGVFGAIVELQRVNLTVH